MNNNHLRYSYKLPSLSNTISYVMLHFFLLVNLRNQNEPNARSHKALENLNSLAVVNNNRTNYDWGILDIMVFRALVPRDKKGCQLPFFCSYKAPEEGWKWSQSAPHCEINCGILQTLRADWKIQAHKQLRMHNKIQKWTSLTNKLGH